MTLEPMSENFAFILRLLFLMSFKQTSEQSALLLEATVGNRFRRCQDAGGCRWVPTSDNGSLSQVEMETEKSGQAPEILRT